MSIWITRPREDGLRLQSELSHIGLCSIVEPLSEVEYIAFDLFKLADATGLLVTSRNGLKGFAAVENKNAGCEDFKSIVEILKGRPLFAVGEATGLFAQDLGFRDVRVGGGRAETLIELMLIEAAKASKGVGQKIYHFRGDKIAFDLEAALNERGGEASEVQLVPVHCYKLNEVQRLRSDFIEKLTKRDIKGVVLMSPRATRVYIRLIKHHQLENFVQQMDHCCLSAAVADPLQETEIKKVSVSAFPDQTHMTGLLKSLYLS